LKPAIDFSWWALNRCSSSNEAALWTSRRSFQLAAMEMQMAKITRNNVRVAAVQRVHLHRNIGSNRLMSVSCAMRRLNVQTPADSDS
jgi:hypothetical protein